MVQRHTRHTQQRPPNSPPWEGLRERAAAAAAAAEERPQITDQLPTRTRRRRPFAPAAGRLMYSSVAIVLALALLCTIGTYWLECRKPRFCCCCEDARPSPRPRGLSCTSSSRTVALQGTSPQRALPLSLFRGGCHCWRPAWWRLGDLPPTQEPQLDPGMARWDQDPSVLQGGCAVDDGQAACWQYRAST